MRGSSLEFVQDFLIKLDMKPCRYASSQNKHFFTKSFHHKTYQDYEQPPQTSQNSYFQSHFYCWKLVESFTKKISVKNIGLRVQHLSNFIFKVFCFLKMWPIFVSSVHIFGRSDGEIIQWKNRCILVVSCPTQTKNLYWYLIQGG